ncbi:20505_t:CDS:1, partial [Cetraspora pellucida]
NGTVVNNVKEYPELLWTMRGAGNAGYGIVTTSTIKIHPVQKIVTRFNFTYDFDQTSSILSVINQLGNSYFHQNLTFATSITKLPELSVDVFGIYLGSAAELQPYIQDFINLSKPKMESYIEGDFYELITYYANSTKGVGNFKVKSFFMNSDGLSIEGAKYLMNFIEGFKCDLRIEMLLLGGEVNKVRRNETAFVHRGHMNHMEIKVIEPSEMCLRDLKIFSTHFQRKYTNYESYQNLIDRQLDNWQCRYYRENFEKLVEIKQKYDPYNLFRWNQSIPTNTEISCY